MHALISSPLLISSVLILLNAESIRGGKQTTSEADRSTLSSTEESLMRNIESENIAHNLRILTKKPHQAGTEANKKVAEQIMQLWKSNGLEDVHLVSYDVLLSYPDFEKPNHMMILNEDGSEEYVTKGVSPPVIKKEQMDKGAGVQWVAYSANGSVEAPVVYCHYGRKEDFEYLKKIGIDLKNKIAMLRYGAGFRGDKVANAQKHGAIGAILFSDPADIAMLGTSNEKVYPNTEWMPRHGAQRGSLMRGNGDPLSPLYPAKEDMFRMRNITEIVDLGIIPSIPVLPLSYGDAFQILVNLDGAAVPVEWSGGLNVTYRHGPSIKNNRTVRISVHSSLSTRTIRNVVGYIHGSTYADEYVILGNHYDAWVYGSIDPNSATAVLAEVARAMSQTMKELKWRPARSMMFCNWDAEEYGIIGSTEFVEEFANILSQRAVVYLNVDNINSNQSLHVATVPTLYQTVTEVSKRITNPMESEKRKGRKTVYDTWINTFPNTIDFRGDAPKLPKPGGGSDHAPFLYYLGVPVADITYRNKTTNDNYPLYHTLYETVFVNEQIFDTNNLAVHRAVGQYWAELARTFADSTILPMNITDLANSLIRIYLPQLNDALRSLNNYSDILADVYHQFDNLNRRSQEFLQEARDFDAIKSNLLQIPASYRNIMHMNNRIIAIDRCFINARGSTGRPFDRHVLYNTNVDNEYSSRTLSSVHALIDSIKSATDLSEISEFGRHLAGELSIVQYSVMCAINTLSDFI